MRATCYKDANGDEVVELRMNDQELKQARSSKEMLALAVEKVAAGIASIILAKIGPVIESAMTGNVTSEPSELERLTRALHMAKAHPDYSYTTVPAASEVRHTMPECGFELNKESNEADEHGIDECWRRRKDNA